MPSPLLYWKEEDLKVKRLKVERLKVERMKVKRLKVESRLSRRRRRWRGVVPAKS